MNTSYLLNIGHHFFRLHLSKQPGGDGGKRWLSCAFRQMSYEQKCSCLGMVWITAAVRHQLTIMSSSEVGHDLFHAILIAHTVLGLDKPIILKPHLAATQDFQMLKLASPQILLVCRYLKQNYHQVGSGVSACKGSSSFPPLTCHSLRVMSSGLEM